MRRRKRGASRPLSRSEPSISEQARSGPKLHALEEGTWVGGFSDPHWTYRLSVKQPNAEIIVYRCRFSVLFELYQTMVRLYQLRNQIKDESSNDTTDAALMHAGTDEPPPPFPAKHWLPWVGKYFDFSDATQTRASQIFASLEFFEKQTDTREELHELLRALPETLLD